MNRTDYKKTPAEIFKGTKKNESQFQKKIPFISLITIFIKLLNILNYSFIFFNYLYF